MTVIQRLVLRYITQFIVVISLILLFSIIGLLILSFSLLDQNINEDISKITPDILEQSIRKENEEIILRDSFKKSILDQNAWLQLIDTSGGIEYSFNTPESMKYKQAYNKTEIIQLMEGKDKTYGLWSIDLNSQPFIVLIQYERPLVELLNKIKNNNSSTLSNTILEDLSFLKANLYIYKDDNLIKTYIKNPNLNTPNLVEIVDAQMHYWDRPQKVASFFDEKSQQTYIVIAKNPSFEESNEISINSTVLKGILITFACTLIFLFILSWLYAYRLGKPLIHIIEWLQLLAKGSYQEPLNKKQIPKSLRENGNLKSSFKPFMEVILSLQKLSNTLKNNEIQQKKIDETREEWISGLSHDLKTPLSAIYGYAVMINNSSYKWSEEELKEFTSTMEQNASYMSDLIEDINLTYRIKNNALPILKEKIEINQFIHKTTYAFMNTQLEKKQSYELILAEQKIYYDIDCKYFTRILHNLLGNAVKYNPNNTHIEVCINSFKEGFAIYIKDNGIGMDDYTKLNLFNRYYRGTTVETSTEGTGLGLAITKQLIELHHGEIKVETEVGKGTVISLLFHHT